MSYLPYIDASNALLRCATCNRMLDGEAAVDRAEICSDCSSRARHKQQERLVARQRRIEEDLA